MHDEEYRSIFDLEEHFWWYAGMRAATASILERERVAATRVLDVGCGTGFTLLWLKELLNCDAAFGVDASPHAAALWRFRGLETATVASANSLPFASEEFDLASCFDVLYQFEPKRARAAIAELFRVLRPGGWLLIREPAYDWLRGGHDIVVGTQHRYTRTELRNLLQTEGFVIKRATYINTLLLWAALPHRWLSRVRGDKSSDVKAVSRLTNSAMSAVLRIEARLLKVVTFPFGLSVSVLAVKQDESSQ